MLIIEIKHGGILI